MSRRRPATRIGCLLAAGAALAVPAVAQASWHTGLPIAPDRIGYGPPVAALGSRGEALGAWTVSAARGRMHRVEVRARHGYRAPWRLTLRTGLLPAATPALAAAMNGSGFAAVVWRASGGDARVASQVSARASWKVARIPSGPPSSGPDAFGSPHLVVADDGSAQVIWAAREGGRWVVRSAVSAGAGAPWRETPALALDQDAAPTAPDLALAADGHAAATWVVPDPGGALATGRVRVALRSAAQVWSPPVDLADDGAAPSISTASGGAARVAWAASAPAVVRTAALDAGGGGWTPPADLAAGAAPRVAIDPGDDVLLGFSPLDAPRGLDALLRFEAGAGALTTRLDPGSGPSDEAGARAGVALSPSGRAVVTWIGPEGAGTTAGMATARAGGLWVRAAQPVGEDVATPAIALGPGDDVLVLTSALGLSGTGRTVVAASFDAVPRARLAGTVRGRRITGGRVAWTVTVQNSSRVAADGGRLRISLCCGTRLLGPPFPGSRRQGRWLTVRLGRLAPRARRVVRLVAQLSRGSSVAAPRADVRAIAVPPTTLRGFGLRAGTAFPHSSP